jgi:hypothetical protein
MSSFFQAFIVGAPRFLFRTTEVTYALVQEDTISM